MPIRPATRADAPAILAFWNPIISGTTITFSPDTHTIESVGALIDARQVV